MFQSAWRQGFGPGGTFCTLAVGKPWLARCWLDQRRLSTNEPDARSDRPTVCHAALLLSLSPSDVLPRGGPEAVPRHTGVIGSPSPVSQVCLARVSEHSPGPAACLTSLVRTKSRTRNDAQRPSRPSFSCSANAQHSRDKAPRPETEFFLPPSNSVPISLPLPGLNSFLSPISAISLLPCAPDAPRLWIRCQVNRT
jgi:hypothetical protein